MCFNSNDLFRDEASLQSGVTKLNVQTIAQFDDHNSLVWRVCWNITGTVLSSSGDDGCVRMFKSKLYLSSYSSLVFHSIRNSHAILTIPISMGRPKFRIKLETVWFLFLVGFIDFISWAFPFL